MCLKNHLSISWFQFSFKMGRGDTPLADPPPLGTSCLGQVLCPCLWKFTPPLPPNPGSATGYKCVIGGYKCFISGYQCVMSVFVAIFGIKLIFGLTGLRTKRWALKHKWPSLNFQLLYGATCSYLDLRKYNKIATFQRILTLKYPKHEPSRHSFISSSGRLDIISVSKYTQNDHI